MDLKFSIDYVNQKQQKGGMTEPTEPIKDTIYAIHLGGMKKPQDAQTAANLIESGAETLENIKDSKFFKILQKIAMAYILEKYGDKTGNDPLAFLTQYLNGYDKTLIFMNFFINGLLLGYVNKYGTNSAKYSLPWLLLILGNSIKNQMNKDLPNEKKLKDELKLNNAKSSMKNALELLGNEFSNTAMLVAISELFEYLYDKMEDYSLYTQLMLAMGYKIRDTKSKKDLTSDEISNFMGYGVYYGINKKGEEVKIGNGYGFYILDESDKPRTKNNGELVLEGTKTKFLNQAYIGLNEFQKNPNMVRTKDFKWAVQKPEIEDSQLVLTFDNKGGSAILNSRFNPVRWLWTFVNDKKWLGEKPTLYIFGYSVSKEVVFNIIIYLIGAVVLYYKFSGDSKKNLPPPPPSKSPSPPPSPSPSPSPEQKEPSVYDMPDYKNWQTSKKKQYIER